MKDKIKDKISIKALVKPKLLIWARVFSRMSIGEAAAKTKFDLTLLQNWESGAGRPSISQLRKLGEAYKRPIAVFFLPETQLGFDVLNNY